MFRNQSVLITGGTGSFGQAFARHVLTHGQPRRVVILSRDELKQFQMRQQFSKWDAKLRFFIGDVRDRERLLRAFDGIDIVVHAAAMKQVPACEYNPLEAVKTNILGATNVIDAAIDCRVSKVLALSTDKAVSPVNLYGATKLCAEKLFTQANAYSGDRATKFSSIRYGNVVGSRGSVIPLFLQQKQTGTVTVTDSRMTRFWITLPQAVQFVCRCVQQMEGGEVFVPKIPSVGLMDLVRVIAPECKVTFISLRPGEKLHEVLISRDEASLVRELNDSYLIQPALSFWNVKEQGIPVGEEFSYASDANPWHATEEEIRTWVQAELPHSPHRPQAA